jgi:hypothetical protein
MNRETVAEIRNKLQTSLTAIEKLDKGERVSGEFVRQALTEIQEAVRLLENLSEK